MIGLDTSVPSINLIKARIEAGVIIDQSKMTMMSNDSVMNHSG